MWEIFKDELGAYLSANPANVVCAVFLVTCVIALIAFVIWNFATAKSSKKKHTITVKEPEPRIPISVKVVDEDNYGDRTATVSTESPESGFPESPEIDDKNVITIGKLYELEYSEVKLPIFFKPERIDKYGDLWGTLFVKIPKVIIGDPRVSRRDSTFSGEGYVITIDIEYKTDQNTTELVSIDFGFVQWPKEFGDRDSYTTRIIVEKS